MTDLDPLMQSDRPDAEEVERIRKAYDAKVSDLTNRLWRATILAQQKAQGEPAFQAAMEKFHRRR